MMLFALWRKVAPYVLMAVGMALLVSAFMSDAAAETPANVAFFTTALAGLSSLDSGGGDAMPGGQIGGDTFADRGPVFNPIINDDDDGGPAPFGMSWPAFGAVSALALTLAVVAFRGRRT